MVVIEVFTDTKLIEYSKIYLNECRKSNKFTDLTLKSSDGESMRVHKTILWSTCPYFQTMFDSNLKECHQNCIQLKNDITIQDLEIIIEYLYTGQAAIPKNRTKIIFEKSNFFQLIELQQFCSKLLIQEIDDENCLQILKYADLFSDNALRNGSIEYIAKNGEKLLDRYLAEFSNNEFEAILSDTKLKICPEKKFIFIINWVKIDLSARSKYIETLLKKVDLLEITEDSMDSEIQSNDTLRNGFSYTLMKMVAKAFRELKSQNNHVNDSNQKNITVVVNRESHSIELSDALEMFNQILTSNPSNVITSHSQLMREQSNQQPTEPKHSARPTKENRHLRRLKTALPYSSRSERYNPSGNQTAKQSEYFQVEDKKHIFVTYNYGIERLNLEKNKWEQQYLHHTDQFHYAIAGYQHNIYLTGGLSPESEPSNVVRYYSERTNKIKRIPSMLEGRKNHKSICLRDKIYSCGGKGNRGSVEYFDFGRETWIREAAMNKSRYCFGLSAKDDSIYAIGGKQENTIERFDVREGDWHIIGKIPSNTRSYRCKSFYMNNSLYCIDSTSSGFIYDLRMLKLKQDIHADSLIRQYDISWDRYDVVTLEGKVYGIYGNKFCQYKDGRWKNLYPEYLKFSIESINLCTL